MTGDSFDTLFQQVVTTFGEDLSRILHGEDEYVAKLNVLVDIIAICVETRISLALDESFALDLVPDIFALAFLLPKALSVPDIPVAQNIWTSWLANASAVLQRQVGAGTCARLQDAIFHTSILVRYDPFTRREMFSACSFKESPLDILQATAEGGIDKLVSGLDDLLPTSTYLDELLCSLRLDPATASLAIIQPLIPPTSSFETAEGPDCESDQQGLGVYARGVMALLYSYAENRDLARTNLWALRHSLALAIYAEELLQVPSLPNPAFSQTVAKDVLQDVLIKVQQLTAYLLTTAAADDGWHVDVVKYLLNGKGNRSLGDLAAFTVDLIQWAQDEDDSLHARILYTILQHALRDASREEGDEWLSLARRLERNCKCIVFCFAELSRIDSRSARGCPCNHTLRYAVWIRAYSS